MKACKYLLLHKEGLDKNNSRYECIPKKGKNDYFA